MINRCCHQPIIPQLEFLYVHTLSLHDCIEEQFDFKGLEEFLGETIDSPYSYG